VYGDCLYVTDSFSFEIFGQLSGEIHIRQLAIEVRCPWNVTLFCHEVVEIYCFHSLSGSFVSKTGNIDNPAFFTSFDFVDE
jgi:hypothetical protein